MTDTKEVTGNRKYKDRLFRMIFQDKADLLSLYNAVNNSHYEDPDALEITTLDDVLYMGMKNDISFLIDDYLNLYEVQSSWNPNMPLRGIFYFSRLYSGYVKTRKLDLYSRTRIKLPTPKYVVFYNGTQAEPEKIELRLSDAFEKPRNSEPCLECIAVVININHGYNKELMRNCQKLYEYAFLVNQIRSHLAKGLTLDAAIDAAVITCLEQGILSQFLTKHRAEVRFMILSEYDEELHLKDTYNCGYHKGKLEGEKRGKDCINALNQILLQQNRISDLKKASADEVFQKKLLKEFHLD